MFVIYLVDCEPVFSSSVLESVIANELKINSDYSNREDICDATNIELTTFMLSVCHIVIVAENWFTDPNLHRYGSKFSYMLSSFCERVTL